jgi:lipopolysaccharide/colanic/teichoic acid biosynthesis glycosyltransferase
MFMNFSPSTENKPSPYPPFKRGIDILLSGGALILLAPLLLILAIAVRIAMGRSLLFSQERPGLGEKPFVLYKFRTMRDIRDVQGILLPDSERLTRFGALLRSSSLDELPELINVLKGDMSLVGPRPLLMRYLPYFSDQERIRFSVRPGITGLAQISGRNELPWDDRMALDVYYARHLSFFLDLKILVSTMWKILTRDGVHADPGQTLQDFDAERRNRPNGKSQ